MVKGSSSFLQGNRFNSYRKQLAVSPDREWPLLPHSFGYGNFVERILHGKKVTTFSAIIDNLVSGIGSSAVDAYEMVHGKVLVCRIDIGVRFYYKTGLHHTIFSPLSPENVL
jgi:hypothetical protein